MIRRISLLLLLVNASVAVAQPLYKWVEADGSITFSPTPPANGINFEKLGTPNPVATFLSDDPLAVESTESPSTPDTSVARVEYAPGNARDLPPAISRSPASLALQPVTTGVAVNRLDKSVPTDSDGAQSAVNDAADYKRSRCQDLKKRVTSLERRLKSQLTPEDMDNTVLHMARYQRSWNQYCAQ